jgi:hypothetical protein
MNDLLINEKILTIRTELETVSVDLSMLLRVKMYDRVLKRNYRVDCFEISNITYLKNGIKVFLINESEGLIIPVIFKSEKNAFRVLLPAGEITEELEVNRKLMEVDLLPELMICDVNDDGFFLTPCFSGTLIRFKHEQPYINRDRIYMQQSEWEKINLMNCFGVNKNGNGILAIVNKGDFFCYVTNELNQGGKNRIYASLGLRHVEGEAVKNEPKEVIYKFLKGEDAEYQGMAKIYRNYLIDERNVSLLKDRIGDNPALAYSVDAMRVKIFMGKKVPCTCDGLSPLTVYTTFKEAETILDFMKEAGINKAVITLVGWNLGGHDGAFPSRFPVEPEMGGEEGLRSLIQKALAMGYQIVPHDNVTEGYRPALEFDPEFLTRNRDQSPLVTGIWGGGQGYKICPVSYLERYGYVFKKIRELGFVGHYYLDAQSSVLWECYDPRHPANEKDYALALAKMTQIPRINYGAVSTELAPAYNLPFIDEVSTIHSINNSRFCLDRLPENYKNIIDRIVPFYQIAVHGLITYQESWVHQYRNQEGGAKISLLKALALGARPSMEISFKGGSHGDFYEDSISDLKDAYHVSFETLKGIHVETIEKYEELAPEVRRITYANGCMITVNWGSCKFKDLEPESYNIVHS